MRNILTLVARLWDTLALQYLDLPDCDLGFLVFEVHQTLDTIAFQQHKG